MGMPENIAGTNMWNIFQDECFKTTNKEIVNGPLNTVRVTEFPDLGLISIQGDTRKWEVEGKNLDEAIKKKPCQ